MLKLSAFTLEDELIIFDIHNCLKGTAQVPTFLSSICAVFFFYYARNC